MVTSTLRVLVIAAATACACGAALAQTAPGFPADPERGLLEQIDLLRRQEGTTAEELVEPLRALALQYQEAGDHGLAVVALQEAKQVMRVNRGLFTASVDDALLLHQEIRSEKALGHSERVWTLQQDLMAIARKNYDDLRMLPVFLEIADDRTETLDEYSTTDFVKLPAGIYVPCIPGPDGIRDGRVVAADARNCPFGTHQMVIDRLKIEILTHYAEAIEVILRNGDYASQELRDLERETLRLAPNNPVACAVTLSGLSELDLVGTCLEPVVRAGEHVFVRVGGRISLLRLIAYEFRSGAPAAARANAFAELADWYVRIAHGDPRRRFTASDEVARKLYERAYALLEGDEAMAEIFSPELPVTLPAYLPNPLASTRSPRYLDVAFAISRYGEAERIEIVAGRESATRAEEADLIRLIKATSFRPRAVGGQLADAAPVVVRYYLSATAPSFVNPPAPAVVAR